MEYIYHPEGTCSDTITFELQDNIVKNIRFFGGCNGNLKALSILLEGATIEEITEKLGGNTCGFKSTSCTDQLTIAINKAYKGEL